MKKARCYNCKYGGRQFKIGKLTHLICEHPQYTKDRFLSGELSPFDVLQVFSDDCDDHEFNQPQK